VCANYKLYCVSVIRTFRLRSITFFGASLFSYVLSPPKHSTLITSSTSNCNCFHYRLFIQLHSDFTRTGIGCFARRTGWLCVYISALYLYPSLFLQSDMDTRSALWTMIYLSIYIYLSVILHRLSCMNNALVIQQFEFAR